MNDCVEKTSCRLCSSKSLDLAFKLPDTPPANALRTGNESEPPQFFPLEVRVCLDCGHSQLGHVVNPELLFSKYKYMSGVSASFKEHLKRLAGDIALKLQTLRKSEPTDSAFRVVEIGSNDGTLLKALEEAGIQACGVDPAIGLVGLCRDNLGLKAVHGMYSSKTHLEAEKQMNGIADCVVANNVLAHIDDLHAVFETARRARTQFVVFEVQYVVDLLASGSFDMVYHEHLDYHALTPLVKALSKWGYTVFDAQRVPTHGGSLRVWAQYDDGKGGTLPLPPEMDILLKQERTLAMWLPSGRHGWVEQWAGLAKTVDRKRKDLTALISSLPAGYKLAVYGAPAKLVTFLYGLGISPSSFQYVIDDAPSKVNFRTPDDALLIQPSTVLKDDALRPDFILVAAWNLFDDIVERIKKTPFRGAVVRVFPELRVVHV